MTFKIFVVPMYVTILWSCQLKANCSGTINKVSRSSFVKCVKYEASSRFRGYPHRCCTCTRSIRRQGGASPTYPTSIHLPYVESPPVHRARRVLRRRARSRSRDDERNHDTLHAAAYPDTTRKRSSFPGDFPPDAAQNLAMAFKMFFSVGDLQKR